MTPVLILAMLLAQQTTPPEKCTLSGTVTDSVTGLPLTKVEIVAEPVGGNELGASTITDPKGNFLMTEVDPGQYRIAARRGGYQDTHYSHGATVTLVGGQKTEDLDIKLVPYGVIAGAVRDSDGEAIIGANVEFYAWQYQSGRRGIGKVAETSTNDLGQYRIATLRPGKYFVSAAVLGGEPAIDHSAKLDGPPAVPIRTFYPGTTEPAYASPVEVTPGVRVTNADIALTRGRAYRVTVHITAPKGLGPEAELKYSVDGFGSVGRRHSADENGNVEITDVPPGNYKIEFGARNGGWGHGECDGSTVPISVGQSDTVVRLAAGGLCPEITGHIRIEGEHPPKLANNGFSEPDGSFKIPLSPGQHVIDLRDITREQDLYVKSIRAGTQDVVRDGFTVSASEHVELEVVLGSDGGRVDGVVSDADDKPVVGATIVLIPNDPALRSRLDFTRDSITDQAGHFELKGAAPGEYKLFAWSDIEQDSWFDPDVLKDVEAKGQPVTVKVKDSQTVKLGVIAAP